MKQNNDIASINEIGIINEATKKLSTPTEQELTEIYEQEKIVWEKLSQLFVEYTKLISLTQKFKNNGL